jgi:hypothetical protein
MKHALNWKPGEYGKGLVHDGAVHTWGVGANQDGSPTHPEYAEKAFGMNEGQYGGHMMFDTAFGINPEGALNVFDDNGWSSNPENEGKVAAKAMEVDPRLYVPGSDKPATWNFLGVAKNDGKWQLVSAAPATMYHWAPKQFRDQIAQEGLRAALPEGDEYVDYDNPEAYRGVYMFNKPPVYNHGTGGFYGDDLWAVDANGLTPQADPGEFDASMVPHDIDPSRIRYLNGQAHKRAWEQFNAERHGHVIGNMRDGWGRFATAIPWQAGQWGKGIYYPETGVLHTWADDRTHLDVWGDDENYSQPGSAHHIVIRPNGSVHDQGAFDRDFGDAQSDVEGLQRALRELNPSLRLDSSNAWSFGPTEPIEEEPSSVSRGEDGGATHGVQTGTDYAGSL